MDDTGSGDQVQMVWPERLWDASPAYTIPAGYDLRRYQEGDEERFFEIMERAGWPGWDRDRLKPWLYRILPGGWLMIITEKEKEIAASSMATHDHTWIQPFCGEVGWTVTDPDHTGKGLGTALVSAVTARFLDAGYRTIHLYTEPWRLAALKLYLKVGYVPLLDDTAASDSWREICAQVSFPFTPGDWPSMAA